MHVELLVGNKRCNVKRLVIRNQAIIGRQDHCDIRVVSTEISREHCRIEIQSQQAILIDLGSTNGTFLNKKRLEAHGEVALNENDEIQVGPAAFSVHLVDVVVRPVIGNEAVPAAADVPDVLNGEETHQPFETAILPTDTGENASDEQIGDPERDSDSLEDLQDLQATEEDEITSLMAGVTSDNELPTLSDDDAFEKFLKDM